MRRLNFLEMGIRENTTRRGGGGLVRVWLTKTSTRGFTERVINACGLFIFFFPTLFYLYVRVF